MAEWLLELAQLPGFEVVGACLEPCVMRMPRGWVFAAHLSAGGQRLPSGKSPAAPGSLHSCWLRPTSCLAAGRDSPSQGFANLIVAVEHLSQMNLYLQIQYGKQITAEGAWPRQDLGLRACPHTWAPLG